MCPLRPALHLAQKVGTQPGSGQILFGTLQARRRACRYRSIARQGLTCFVQASRDSSSDNLSFKPARAVQVIPASRRHIWIQTRNFLCNAIELGLNDIYTATPELTDGQCIIGLDNAIIAIKQKFGFARNETVLRRPTIDDRRSTISSRMWSGLVSTISTKRLT